MALAPKLELRASQSLVMTQQLQQSIKLLQMNAQELNVYVEEQLEQNPFLMEEERTVDQGPPEGSDERREQENESEDYGDTYAEGTVEDAYQHDDWQDAGGGPLAGAEMRMSVTVRDSDGDEMDFGDTRAKEITLREHLLEQLQIEIQDPLLRRIGIHLIDLVDEGGYIKEDLSLLAAQLGTDIAKVEEALALLQKFDPVGVCARSVAECMALQLKERDRFDPAMQCLIEHLHLLADGNLEALKRRCGVDGEDLKQMILELRALNPKPGLAFVREVAQVAVPDVAVKRDRAGRWHVELNSSALPRVLVNRRYYAKIAPMTNTKAQDKKYVTDKLQEASWLVKALDQRAHTILKVATEIVAQQESFFRMGIHHLKPLTLKDIARETGFHESTVSRVTSGKYLISPRGTYELKYFFTSGLSHGAGGDDVSSQTVRHLIKEFIDKETADKVLSDDDIAELLKAKNINVARRTVAKYREGMDIPSSTIRRRLKNSKL